jgi:hypothetical protein
MSATIQIQEMSALTTGTDKTSGTVRFKVADNATVDGNNPIVVPGSGTAYSYTKKLRAKMTVAPNTNVSNLRWYADGANSFGTGIGVTVKNLGTTWAANYITAQSGGSDLFGYTSAAPLSGCTTDTGPWLPASNGNFIGDLIELQMTVASTASNGALSAETLTLAYDEI